jgi:hypothetical protein
MKGIGALTCARCSLVTRTEKMCCLNPFSVPQIIPKKRTILCMECKTKWYRIRNRINGNDFMVVKIAETEAAWKEFMTKKEKVQFT